MKKLLALTCLVFTCAVLCFGVTACTKPTEQTHVHSYTAVATMPTCTEMGYTTHTCSCGETYVDSYTSKLGHDFTSYTSDNNATCTADGTETAKCSNPGCSMTDTRTQANSKLDHSFVLTIAEDKYLDNAATCTSKATYYKSCVCGLAGAETFEHGEMLDHSYVLTVAEDRYLDEAATCTSKATYYKSCECGAVGTETFESGEKLDHSYVLTVAEDRYLDEVATCTSKATYYKSCECGLAGAETFEYGEMLDHSYVLTVAEDKYLDKAATCTSKAIYYKSCVCGLAGTETFEYGYNQHNFVNGLCNSCNHYDATPYLIFTLVNGEYYSASIADKTKLPSKIIIPSTYNGKKVPLISGSFSECSSLTSVILEDGIIKIGDYAFFACTSLTSVMIPASVTQIISTSFNGCCSLANITVDCNNLYYKDIDGNLYTKNCSTLLQYATGKTDTSFTIPDGVETIGSEAFSGSNSLKSVAIPDGVETIGSHAFSGCDSLTVIVIPDSVTSIGDSAFSHNDKLRYVEIGDGVKTVGISAFSYNTLLDTVKIGNGLKTIATCAFAYCSELKSVVLPKTLEKIEDGAFIGCQYLTWVHYTGTVTDWAQITIGADNTDLTTAQRFYYTETAPTDGENIYWHYNNNGSIERWNEGFTFYLENGTYSISGYSSYNSDKLIIPKTYKGVAVTRIEDAAFFSKYYATIIMDENIQEIGCEAFAYYGKDVNVVLPKSLKTVDDYAFDYTYVQNVYYKGTPEDWNKISIGEYGNDYLTGATRYYYSETQPTDTTYNYWHYDASGNPVAW